MAIAPAATSPTLSSPAHPTRPTLGGAARGDIVTEQEWLTSSDPMPMLAFVRAMSSDRKLRLFAVACCRPLLSVLGCVFCSQAADVGEAYADGAADERAISEARGHAHGEWMNYGDSFTYLASATDLLLAAVDHHPHQITWLALDETERQIAAEGDFDEVAIFRRVRLAQPGLLRCVFGNPFCPVTADPSWLTPTVVSLADAIYADRAFDRLPILADALEEAGCDNIDMLNHCRSDGPHVRGCWVVDLVLGKE